MKTRQNPIASTIVATCLALALGLAVADAAPKKDSGPTQAQIDCQNRAVNDYYDQIKECDKALNDIPDQNTLCQSDAAGDLKRNKAACTAQASTGGRFNTFMKGILGGGAQMSQ